MKKKIFSGLRKTDFFLLLKYKSNFTRLSVDSEFASGSILTPGSCILTTILLNQLYWSELNGI